MVASQLSLHRTDLKLMPFQFYNPQVATFRTIDKSATHKLLPDSTTEGACKEQVIPIFQEDPAEHTNVIPFVASLQEPIIFMSDQPILSM